RAKGQPLELLFVGGLSQRKGLSYLFAAVEALGKAVELTVIGRRPKVTCAALDRALAKHRHIESLPHAEVLEAMEASDVFVFPSVFEGFGLVLLEAMSRGVPCITTPNTAGPDIITDGVDGYIVPIRDVDAIVNRIENLLQNPDSLAAMSAAALATARQMTWERYGDDTVRHLREVLAG
ncbi:MAG: glycosyltransferase, partial [Puniceicoccaceae bacterium]